MNRRFDRHIYLLIVAAAIAVLALSAFFFTRYLEKQTKEIPEVSSFVALETSPPTVANRMRVTPTTVPQEAITGTSSANEILQKLTESINNPQSSPDNYRAFKRGQLDGISLEEYQLYVKLLKDIMRGRVETYSSMTYSERKSTTASILEHDPMLEAFLKDAGFYWLEYKRMSEQLRLPILLSKNNKGQVFLSREWVKSCLELRNFSSLYFGALVDQNEEAVERLTYSLSPDPSIRGQKTDHLMDYYRDVIKAEEIGVADIISLRLDAVTFAIPIKGTDRDLSIPVAAQTTATSAAATTTSAALEKTEASSASDSETAANELAGNGETETLAETSGETADETAGEALTEASGETTKATAAKPSVSVSAALKHTAAEKENTEGPAVHYVTIYKRSGNFIAVDGVPATDWRTPAIIQKDGVAAAAVGESLTGDALIERFGMPQGQYKFRFIGKAASAEAFYRLIFPHVELIVSQKDPQGALRIESIILRKPAYTAAQHYRIGETLEDLLRTYLYIDTLGYTYYDQGGNQVRMYLNERLQVKMIVMETPAYRAELLLQEKGDETPATLLKPKPTPTPTVSNTSAAATEENGDEASAAAESEAAAAGEEG